MKMLNITEGILLKLNYPAQIGATPSEQNVGTIYIFTNPNYTGTSVGYSYTRSANGNYRNGRATNTNDISLTGVKESDTLYIRYVNGNRTYTGSFTLSDAIDNNGVTITITQ